MITISVADDHPLILEGLIEKINAHPEFELLDQASNGKELLIQLGNRLPDLVICDINMPGMNGLEVIRESKEKGWDTKFIVLSVHDEKPIIQKAFRTGAYGYLLKSSETEMIYEAILKVNNGKKYFDPEVMEIALQLNSEDNSDVSKKVLLTDRELEIITLIVDGLSNAEIADKLFISKRTVDTHRNNILQKLEIRNTAQLVKFALKNNLAE